MEKTDAKAGRASASCSSPTLIWWLQHTRFFLFFFFRIHSFARGKPTTNLLFRCRSSRYRDHQLRRELGGRDGTHEPGRPHE